MKTFPLERRAARLTTFIESYQIFRSISCNIICYELKFLLSKRNTPAGSRFAASERSSRLLGLCYRTDKTGESGGLTIMLGSMFGENQKKKKKHINKNNSDKLLITVMAVWWFGLLMQLIHCLQGLSGAWTSFCTKRSKSLCCNSLVKVQTSTCSYRLLWLLGLQQGVLPARPAWKASMHVHTSWSHYKAPCKVLWTTTRVGKHEKQ